MTQEKEKEVKKLPSPRFEPAEYRRNIFRAITEEGTTFEETLDPTYWVHVAVKLQAGDRIEVVAEDGSYFGELYVIQTGRVHAKVAQLMYLELSPSEPTENEDKDYKVAWKGPHSKWAVIKIGVHDALSKNHQTQEAAQLWLKDYLKTLAA